MTGEIREDGSIALAPDSKTEGWAMTQWALMSVDAEISLHMVRSIDGCVLIVRAVPVAETFTPQGFSIKNEKEPE